MTYPSCLMVWMDTPPKLPSFSPRGVNSKTPSAASAAQPCRFSPPVTSQARAGLWLSELSQGDPNPICLTGRCISYDGPCSPLIVDEAR